MSQAWATVGWELEVPSAPISRQHWSGKRRVKAISVCASVGMLLAASWALQLVPWQATSKIGLLGYAAHGRATLHC